jgi:UDP-2,4-diacetamido-2,4,6-trideoxy-beta-L-altropyranose hydrolase
MVGVVMAGETPLITFCCDASLRSGSGHVMRCLALAQGFREAGLRCRFIVGADAPAMIPALADWETVVDPDFAPRATDAVIIDNYTQDIEYEQLWRGVARVIGVLDDLANRRHDCDFLIDQTYNRMAEDYKDVTPASCALLCGSPYAILRPQFTKSRSSSLECRKAATRIEHVFISFGSTNPDGITERVLNALAQFKDWKLEITIAMGGKAQTIAAVQAMADSEAFHTVTLQLNAQDMASLMARADLAIGAGGTMSWERCCLGLPALLIEIADNQRVIAQNLDSAGAVRYLGEQGNLTENAIFGAFQEICGASEKLGAMSEKAAAICDGAGTDRIVAYVKGLL